MSREAPVAAHASPTSRRAARRTCLSLAAFGSWPAGRIEFGTNARDKSKQTTAQMIDDGKKVETTIEQAARRQIHLAIALLHRSELEAAITLAAAAEGMLPKPDKPYF